MIINVLDQKINDMKKLQTLENQKANQKQQGLTDIKYHVLVENIHKIVSVFEILYKRVNIEQDENMKSNILDLLYDFKVATEIGLADKEKILLLEDKLKTIQVECKKNWVKQYSELTNAKISTLKVISGIDAEKISFCLNDIQKAEDWNTDLVVFQTMIEGLKSADQLIANLGLNQEIILFLQKMNQGKATLPDLSDDVLNWIKKEKIESKIKLSFRRII